MYALLHSIHYRTHIFWRRSLFVRRSFEYTHYHSRKQICLHRAQFAEQVDTLIQLGAKLNVKCAGGRYPLHTARNFQVMQALVKHGADVNALDSNNLSPLCHAINNQLLPLMAVHLFVEKCMPDINIGLLQEMRGFKEYKNYFLYQLPRRHDKCKRIVLLLIGCNAFKQKDVSYMVAKYVWKTRRNSVWE